MTEDNIEVELTDEELDELEAAQAAAQLAQAELAEKLGKVLVANRDNAVKYRRASGIEMQWAEDQAYYEGADDNARSLFYKGLNDNAPLIKRTKPKYRSKVFLNITRPYVETAASKVIEVLCPTDARNWSIKPTAVPDMPEQPTPLVQALEMAAQEGPVQPDPLEEVLKLAKRQAKGAQTWVDDKLQECDFSGELRKMVDESSLLGTGVMRGPVPGVRRTVRLANGVVEVLEEIVPQSKKISVWNCYPDPACGDDIHRGQFFIEHDLFVEKQVRDLVSDPSYSTEALLKVIEEGARGGATDAMAMAPHDSTDPVAARYHVWYYYGFLKLEEARALNCDCGEDDELTNVGVPVIVTMINDTVVKAHLNQLVDGRFPYDFMCWQKQAGSPFGIGIARQIRSCQSILNAHVRAMMENSGLSSGPQIVLARGSVMPADGSWEITPRKVWLLKADADITDVGQAINAFNIPSNQNELLAAIDFALKMAENVTGLPILLQGQTGPNGVPDTVGGMQLLVSNASSLLRRMARIFDDSFIKPHIQSYYRYMLTYAEDDSIKGDFKVVAHGSTSLIARDQKNIFLTQVAPQMMAVQAYGIDPVRLFKKIAIIGGLDDPEEILYTPQELKVIQEAQAAAGQNDPRVLVAQLNNQTRQAIAQLDNQTDQVRIQRDIDRDTAYVQSETMRTQVTAEVKMAELQMRRDLALLEYANRERITLEQLKAKLAIEGGRNDLARELASMPTVEKVTSAVAEQLQPNGEPPGRAPDGMGPML